MSDSAGAHDNASLMDVVELIRRRFVFIVMFIVASLFVGVGVALNTEPLFKSSVLLTPAAEGGSQSRAAALIGGLGSLASIAGLDAGGDTSIEKTIAVLKSRKFTHEFLNQNDRVKKLFPDLWDEENSRWNRPSPSLAKRILSAFDDNAVSEEVYAGPSNDIIYKTFDEVRKVTVDHTAGLVTLTIELPDPVLAKSWANQLVFKLNEHMRANDILEAKQSIEYLKSQINTTPILEMKNILYALMESKVQTIMLATVRDEYVFKVVDPAVEAELPFKPKKTVIVIGFTIAGMVLSILLVFLGNLSNQLKRSNHKA